MQFPGGKCRGAGPEDHAGGPEHQVVRRALQAASVLGIYQTLNLSTGIVELHRPPQPVRPAKEAAPATPSEAPSGGGYVGKISIPMGRRPVLHRVHAAGKRPDGRAAQLRQQTMNEVIAELSREGEDERGSQAAFQ